MKRALLIVGGVLLLPLLGLLYYKLFVFHITNTTPDTGRVSNISPFIDIHFNKSLDDKNIELSVVESPITGHSIIDGKTLRIGLDPLDTNQTYTIEIYKINSTKGDAIVNKTIRFTTRDIPFEKLPKSQRIEILKAQDTPNGTKTDPILTYLPYGGLHYKLEAVYDNDTLIIQAQLILSAADVKIDKANAIERYKSEVKDYIASVGFSPDAYTIQYQIIEPSIY